mgnify:CR=1 FL=1
MPDAQVAVCVDDWKHGQEPVRLVGPFTSMRSLEAAVCAHRQWDGLVCDQGGRICRVQASSLTEPHTLFLWKHQLLFIIYKIQLFFFL